MSYAKYKDLGSKNDTKPAPSQKRPSISENYKPRQQAMHNQIPQHSQHNAQHQMGQPMMQPQQQMGQPMLQPQQQPIMQPPQHMGVSQQMGQPMMQPQHMMGGGGSYKISNDADKNNLIASNKLAVVYVWGTFCGPCKQIAPLYEELANKYNTPGNVILAKEDVALKISPNIRGVPTFQFFLNGKLVDQVVGADTVSLTNKIIQYSN